MEVTIQRLGRRKKADTAGINTTLRPSWTLTGAATPLGPARSSRLGALWRSPPSIPTLAKPTAPKDTRTKATTSTSTRRAIDDVGPARLSTGRPRIIRVTTGAGGDPVRWRKVGCRGGVPVRRTNVGCPSGEQNLIVQWGTRMKETTSTSTPRAISAAEPASAAGGSVSPSRNLRNYLKSDRWSSPPGTAFRSGISDAKASEASWPLDH